MKVVLVDYGMGNIGSINNMLKKLNVNPVISNQTTAIETADKIILPGVGSFDSGIRNIRSLDLEGALLEAIIARKNHILGLCLGLQLLAQSSEEGNEKGLNVLPCNVVRFRQSPRIPHMGWNMATPIRVNPLLVSPAKFYFAHSYHLEKLSDDYLLCTTEYGYTFTSGVWKDNIFGLQFHPEKSHNNGLEVLKRFLHF